MIRGGAWRKDEKVCPEGGNFLLRGDKREKSEGKQRKFLANGKNIIYNVHLRKPKNFFKKWGTFLWGPPSNHPDAPERARTQ